MGQFFSPHPNRQIQIKQKRRESCRLAHLNNSTSCRAGDKYFLQKVAPTLPLTRPIASLPLGASLSPWWTPGHTHVFSSFWAAASWTLNFAQKQVHGLIEHVIPNTLIPYLLRCCENQRNSSPITYFLKSHLKCIVVVTRVSEISVDQTILRL